MVVQWGLNTLAIDLLKGFEAELKGAVYIRMWLIRGILLYLSQSQRHEYGISNEIYPRF